jgi:hypothetical protein
MPSHYVDIGARSLESLLLSHGLSPLSVAALTLLFLPLALLAWCWCNGTLRIAPTPDNPTGHGLFSPINLYLVILPVLNYSIFEYYITVQAQLGRLQQRGILPATVTGPFAKMDAIGLSIMLVAWTTAVCLAFASLQRQRRTMRTWLCDDGRPRPVAYYFHVVFFVFQLAILFSWFLHHIVTWIGLHFMLQDAQLDPFAPDQMLGLSPLSPMIWWAFVTMSLIAFMVMLWLAGGRFTLASERFTNNPGHPATAIATSICATLIVVVPLLTAHAVMKRKRIAPLDRLAAEITRLSGELEQSIRGGSKDVEERRTLLDAVQKLYADADRSTTWPISPGTLTVFPVGLLSPIAPIAGLAAKRALRRWRSRSRSARLSSEEPLSSSPAAAPVTPPPEPTLAS